EIHELVDSFSLRLSNDQSQNGTIADTFAQLNVPNRVYFASNNHDSSLNGSSNEKGREPESSGIQAYPNAFQPTDEEPSAKEILFEHTSLSGELPKETDSREKCEPEYESSAILENSSEIAQNSGDLNEMNDNDLLNQNQNSETLCNTDSKIFAHNTNSLVES